MSHDGGGYQGITRAASFLIFFALLTTLVVSIAPNVNTVVVQLAEGVWPGYASELRTDPEQPECVLEELDEKLKDCPAAGEEPEGTPEGGDPFGGENPFGDDGGEGGDEGGDPFGGENPFGEDGGGDAPAPAPAPEPAEDPFGGENPFGGDGGGDDAGDDGGDPFGGGNPFEDGGDGGTPEGGDPFGDEDPFGGGDPFADGGSKKPDINCAAVRALRDRCAIRHEHYTDVTSRITPAVRNFRNFEGLISDVARFPWWKQLLVVLFGLGAFVTTLHREHIALRDPRNVVEHRVKQGAELAAMLLMLASQYSDWMVQQESTAEIENASLPLFWGTIFVVLGGLNLFHIAKPPKDLEGGEGTTPVRLIMVVPLFAYMVVISGLYFLIAEGHASGLAIYLHKFVQIPNIYLGIGLYIWAGMLLRRTRIAPLIFRVAEPLGLPPAILAWLVVVFAAFPTAYSGASGIFVIAAGAVVFERLRAAGASKRLAVAATAMSGSLGVVLKPCLVVVLIAILNKQVTTAELFGWGLWVFALTVVLSLLAFLWMNDKGWHMHPLGEAVGPMGTAALKVLPFVGIAIAAMLGFGFFLGTWLNEHTAPYVVPVTMLALITFDKFRSHANDGIEVAADDPAAQPLWPSLLGGTEESSHHVGALLMLMGCSVGLGGMVERSEIMYAIVPEQFGSPFLAMSFLVIVMVLVGMTMDALGAVILVSFTVAKIAYDNGIDPVHFWMMVLVAFELGYLTPPVSLNHLLARQVIGPESHVEDDPIPGGSFYKNYEHIIMPMVVMGTALVLVAYVPLFFY